MARKLPSRLLCHVATPLVLEEGDARAGWVEGEPGDGPVPVEGAPFACVLFLPLAAEAPAPEQTWRPARTVVRPTVLWNLAAAVPQPTQGLELWIDAPDLAVTLGASRVRWIVEGEPQPFGRPGAAFAAQAIVRRVSGP